MNGVYTMHSSPFHAMAYSYTILYNRCTCILYPPRELLAGINGDNLVMLIGRNGYEKATFVIAVQPRLHVENSAAQVARGNRFTKGHRQYRCS